MSVTKAKRDPPKVRKIKVKDYLDNIYEKYPIPCEKECGLQKPCVLKLKCSKWIAIDFMRWKEKRELRLMILRAQEEKRLNEMAREDFLEDYQEWDDMERT